MGASSTDVDEITVELYHASTLALVATTTTVLKTDGTASGIFNSSYSGSYYVAIKHRSALQTWSDQPISFASNPTFYDFSNAIIKAFGSNLRELEPGVFGFFIGDINQDESIDNSDSSDLFNDIENSNLGFLTTDLNGDGSVDNSDSDNFFNNISNSVFSNHP